MDLTSIRKIAGLLEQASEKKTKKVALSEDLQTMYKHAGMTAIMEAFDDDDDDFSDDDEDVKAATSEAKKRNIKLPDIKAEVKPKAVPKDQSDDDEDEDDKPRKSTNFLMPNWEKAIIKKPTETTRGTKERTTTKAPKKQRAPGEAAPKQGKPKNELSKSGVCRAYWRNNPEGSVKGAWAEMVKNGYTMKESNGIKEDKVFTKHGWNTLCNKAKKEIEHERATGESKKIEEMYVIAHPHMNSFILHENRELNRNQWVSNSEISDLPPYMFESKQEATDYARHLRDYQSMSCTIKRIKFDN